MVKLTYFSRCRRPIRRILTQLKLTESPLYTGLQRLWICVLLLAVAWQVSPQGSGGPNTSTTPFTVVLDAGHGGHDPGNLGNGYLEKNIALNIVLEVGKVLEKEKDVKVVYTRRDDSFVDLYVRGEIANKAKADLFVSVHCDSHTSNAHGAGTFVLGLHANKQNFEIAKKENSVIYLEDNYETRYAEYDINSPESVIGLTIMQEEFLDQSILLGKLMQDRFTKKLGRNDRKVKQAGFIVLHQTFMPSVLIETGFLTNKNEGGYLNSSKGQIEMGKAIAEAIMEYRESIGANTQPYLAEDTAADTDVVDMEETPTETEAERKPDPVIVEKKPEVAPVKQESAQATVESTAVKEEPAEVQKEPEQASPNPTAMKKETAEEQTKPSEAVIEAVKAVNPSVVFKIQLMAVSQDPDLDPARFKGLNPLSKEKYQSMFRILYGYTKSYEKARGLQQEAVNSGFGSAYIVAYRDGVRIPVKDVVPEGSR